MHPSLWKSGTFQYVNSDLCSKLTIPQFLLSVTSIDIDDISGQIFLLRREQPFVVVLDYAGTVAATWNNTSIVTGHSIKTRRVGGRHGTLIVYVTDMDMACIRVYDENGNAQAPIGPNVGQGVVLGKVTDIAWDVNDILYVTDGDVGGPNDRVVLLGPGPPYAHLKTWGCAGSQLLQFKLPHAIVVDPLSRVWVVDAMNSRVQVVNASNDTVIGVMVFPGLKLYDIKFSTIRSDHQKMMAYISGNSLAEPAGPTGVLMLIEVPINPANFNDIGTTGQVAQPLLSWSVPCMLHGLAVTGMTMRATPVPKLLIGTVSTTDPVRAFEMARRRPLLQPDNTPKPPLWPTSFSAVVLSHPFKQNEPMCVANITYTEKRAMIFDVYTLDGVLVTWRYEQRPNGVHVTTQSWLGSSDLVKTTCVIPSYDWLVRKNVHFQGNQPILRIPSAWWHQDVKTSNGDVVNWHWFRTDTNVPWRTMKTTSANPDFLPRPLADFALIYWPTFKSTEGLEQSHVVHNANPLVNHPAAGVDPNLSVPRVMQDFQRVAATSLPDAIRAANLAVIQTLLPGIQDGNADGFPLPTWPDQFFLTCTMTPVSRVPPMSTEVLYNWPAKSQRTRMFDSENQSVTDIQIVKGTAYVTERFADGTNTQQKPPFSLGVPRPDWAQTTGKICAVIHDNPDLSPGTVTRIFSSPIDDPHQLWSWYATGDVPVTFCQTNPPPEEGAGLAMAEYYSSLQITDLIDPNTFFVEAGEQPTKMGPTTWTRAALMSSWNLLAKLCIRAVAALWGGYPAGGEKSFKS